MEWFGWIIPQFPELRIQLNIFYNTAFADEAEEELNKFLRSMKVIDIRRELVMTFE